MYALEENICEFEEKKLTNIFILRDAKLYLELIHCFILKETHILVGLQR